MIKKIHRFHVPKLPSEESFSLNEKNLTHQLYTVLHFKVGEEIAFFDDTEEEVVCTIQEISPVHITLIRKRKLERSHPINSLVAAISIPKGDTFELIVQKLTELGVQEIVPLLSDRTVKKAVRMDRLQKISDEALEQSGGTRRVRIYEPMTLMQCLQTFNYPALYFDVYANDLIGKAPAESIMYIGPEGGWSEADLSLLKTHAQAYSLGSRVLRTETAAIVAAYTILWH